MFSRWPVREKCFHCLCMKLKRCGFYLECADVTEKHRWVIPPFFWQLRRWLPCNGGSKGNTEAYETNHSSAAIISRVTRWRLHREPCWNQMDAAVYTNKLCTCMHSLAHVHTHIPFLEKTISTPLILTEEDNFGTHTHTHSWVHAHRASLVHTVL